MPFNEQSSISLEKLDDYEVGLGWHERGRGGQESIPKPSVMLHTNSSLFHLPPD